MSEPQPNNPQVKGGAVPYLTVDGAPTDMFRGDRYGQVKDPFGVIWALNSPLKK